MGSVIIDRRGLGGGGVEDFGGAMIKFIWSPPPH